VSIYLDHAATSFPKPSSVIHQITTVLRRIGANPGRSDHKMARRANQIISETREAIAQLIGASDRQQLIFTCNATEAINIALKGILKRGEHVFTSSYEHNSVIRPLKGLEKMGVHFTPIPPSGRGCLNITWLKKNLKKKTKLIVLNHASNVTGDLLPIQEIGAMAKSKGFLFLVDAAQTVGATPINIQKMHIDFLACSGHKSLYGPQGTGFLYIRPGIELKAFREGGTGTDSEFTEQPSMLPSRFESGTLNTPGIAGLGAGVAFVQKEGIETIRKKEKGLTRCLLQGLKKIRGIRIYGPQGVEERIPVISFNMRSVNPMELAFILDEYYDILVRAGLHCAPQAHQTIGTFPLGTLRVSLGYFNTFEDMESLLRALREISQMKS
jgi:cysteine desulfurase / selenocysteine lyase